MARNMRLALQDEQMAEAFDEDAVDQGFVDYGSDPSVAPRGRASRDIPMPKFLGGDGEASGPQTVGLMRWDWLWNWRERLARPWLVRGAVIAAVAAAIAFGVVYLDHQFDLFATAKAALFGAPTDDADASSAPDSTDVAQPADAIPSTSSTTVGMRTSPATAKAAPTRDDIAAALRSARPDPTDGVEPLAGSPARTLGADEVTGLFKRAKGLIAVGDIVAARLLLERAADAQDVNAALLLAQTYDPAVLGTTDVRTITPDRAAARSWYERAAGLGSVNAKQRLAQMQN